VLDQGYPDLEYIVIDGGSTDGSAQIAERYAHRLHYWRSEPDGGQYAAINAGFARSSGEIMAWLNADDQYMPWTLSVVGEVFARFPDIEWLTSQYQVIWDERGRAVHCGYHPRFSRRAFFRGMHLPGNIRYHRAGIQQESTFWRRALWDRAGGGVDERLSFAADFELWARFYQHAELFGLSTPLGGFRRHADQKTAGSGRAYHDEAMAALLRHGGRPFGPVGSAVRYRLAGVASAARRVMNFVRGRREPGEYVRWTRGRPGRWSVRRM
jgi:glycosyltransferase involved in cell wall biosynthesis